MNYWLRQSRNRRIVDHCQVVGLLGLIIGTLFVIGLIHGVDARILAPAYWYTALGVGAISLVLMLGAAIVGIVVDVRR